jgi:type IV pilus assembly protein PilB
MAKRGIKGSLGQLMVESGAISTDQLDSINKKRDDSNKSLCRVLVEFGYIDEKQIQKMMSQLLDIPQIPLTEIEINPEVAHLISSSTANGCKAIPVLRHGKILLLAMDNPFSIQAIEDIKSQTDLVLRCVQANPQEILDQINRHFLNSNKEST